MIFVILELIVIVACCIFLAAETHKDKVESYRFLMNAELEKEFYMESNERKRIKRVEEITRKIKHKQIV